MKARLTPPLTKPGRFLLVLILLFPLARMAPAQRKCGWDQAVSDAIARHPELRAQWEELQTGPRLSLRLLQATRLSAGPVTIPVVVHIVLQNPSLVTDSEVRSQIAVLNRDYNAANPDTAEIPGPFKPLLGEMQMDFCLARRDPQGNPTQGIVRVATSQSQFSVTNACQGVKHQGSGGSDAWNDSSYLNIWVCNLESGYLGVTTPPGMYPEDEQGVVIQYTAFGTVGNLDANYDLGRTTTHEIGHYFNLLHPWGAGDGTCSPGDYVGDTPPQQYPVYGCPAFPDLDPCSSSPPGILFNDFMEYTDDDCMHLFTRGQVARMQASLYSQRAPLLSSQGCVPVVLSALDARVDAVLSPSGKICSSLVNPVAVLENRGLDTLTSVNLSYQLDQGPPIPYHWTGMLPSLGSDTIPLSSFTVTGGNHILTIYSSNPNGSPDEQPSNDTASTSFRLDPVAVLPFSEGFEEAGFPPPGWVVVNPDGSFTWEQAGSAAHGGTHSAFIRNFADAQNGPVDDLVSPVFNVGAGDSLFLGFWLAAAVQTGLHVADNPWDTLEVLVSTDCGQTGKLVYQHWGPNLVTDSLPDGAEFVPNSSQWRKDSVDLSSWIGQGNFQVIFRNICNNENDIYLDDINLYSRAVNPNLAARGVLVVPNPSSGKVTVLFLKVTPALIGVNVYDASGRLVISQPASAVENNRLVLNLANDPDGVYFVEIVYRDGNTVRKLVKTGGGS